MRILGYIITTSLLFISCFASAQSDIVPDTIQGKYIPTGIRVGVDLISPTQAIINDGFKGFTGGENRELHLSADVDFYRYFLNFEFGKLDREWRSDNGIYTNSGTFYKIGPDVNFLHRDPDGSTLFFGLRYAFANFSDQMTYNINDPIWGVGSGDVHNGSLSSNWFEVTTGLKVKITRILWLGYTGRFKFASDTFEGNNLIPHWVPGYGRADETSAWGLDYWLIIKIPFKKDK
ncbi:hypothetical protein E1176_17785 [Fulvivirga sp. RKSG066]|uniref:DUF6048 family protein n=1 Tax=Fulvivirga aurantia TaxID=2529383 RepID=UPI0012BD448D|nr:DUF6048 family protein [Fulvivirga aurantia]MTI22888.1 hypothetical protein [Fulvivirga aurantia]